MTYSPLYMDGLVGPTHHFGGLSFGNRASMSSRRVESSPKKAALQGLAKMKLVMDMGVKQAFVIPHARPDLKFLHDCGFKGDKKTVLGDAYKASPSLLASAFSSSFMWAANMGVISSSAVTGDGKVHITPANLAATVHRHIEPEFSSTLLNMMFPDSKYFTHHKPVYKCFSDEGAANMITLLSDDKSVAMTVFVYGRSESSPLIEYPKFYPARQTKEAIDVIIRNHQLDSQNVMIIQQSPQAIDAGVFHNDVISFGANNILICHDNAFVNQEALLPELLDRYYKATHEELCIIQLSDDCLSLDDVVESYLFNSQLVEKPDGSLWLLLPQKCKEFEEAAAFCEHLVNDSKVISGFDYVALDQSMKNGGGPACLRQQLYLNEKEHAAFDQRFILTPKKYALLTDWVNTTYRDEVSAEDFQDDAFVNDAFKSLDELTQLLDLGSVYFFQK